MPIPMPISVEELDQLANEYGTPLQIYDEQMIRDNAQNLLSTFRKKFTGFKEFYAVKALPNPAILKVKDSGMGHSIHVSLRFCSTRGVGLTARPLQSCTLPNNWE
jgi:diaminopimelate decarboxylase